MSLCEKRKDDNADLLSFPLYYLTNIVNNRCKPLLKPRKILRHYSPTLVAAL